MAQLMTVKLARFDGSPWGFRLQGGIDFAQPLCIQKVNGGSPAETAGLQAGDAIIKVNNTDVFNLRHKEAQDVIVKAGNSFEISIHRGGASTWKPQITPVGALPKPAPLNNNVAPVTKTSLAVNKPEAAPIGSGHNNLAKPFGAPQLNGNSITSSSITSTSQVDTVKSITSKQYNTPVGLYSEENIAETLSAQAEVLASGVLGVNFKKNERKYEPNNSEVLRMVQEVDQEPRDAADPEGKLAEFEYKENLRNIRNGAFQSGTFKRLQAALDEECHPKDPAFAPNSSLRKVTAPETRPAPQANNTPSNNKTQLPPGQNICSECERLIVGVFVRIKERNLHVDCFKCNTCGASLKNIGYFNIGTKLYCDVHAKMAARKNPPGPNLEPVAVQPGQFPPAGAIPAHVAAAANLQSPVPLANPPAPLNQPNSAVNAPLPFHTPRKGTSHVSAPRTYVQGPTPPSSAPVQQAPAPKPFFSPPPPTVSSAHMNKPIGGGYRPYYSTFNRAVHSKATGFGGAPPANNAGNAKGGSLAGTTAPRRGRGVLSAPVAAGGRVPLCGHCSGQIRGPFITAMGKTWCPDHFICVNAQCQRPLQDCGFVEEKGDLYCEFCFEQFLAPACDKCRKKIKGDCLNAIGKHFHPECFNCAYCGKLFGNSPFFLEDGLPYCEGDWNELFTTKCFACGFPIEAGDRWVEALNNNYHSQCFNCTSCKKNLEGQSFFAKQGRPFCKAHAR
ncbi:PDZ and LIM domain protein Zasp isoform X6 [Neocloeon triangulifer]|uniref:PDZ and LIM domain protein Zasp isoform X6 n=1 Tax=Neocloeon triangulifer TaxID=2078957 RepID=UPI00286EE30A|nr:PDZ and LIM domain protein Zasp isoform X6 [Neocloeon triangulifer]